jgi:hypothetical protein
MRAQLFMLGGLLLVVGSPAFAADWGDTAVRAATRMAIESDDRHREYDDRGGWVSAPATGGAVYGAFASAGYHAVGAPLARVVGPGRGPANDGPDSRLPPSKLRP